MLPTFLVIGAAKSGTTSLHHYLGQHPDVSMSSRKELHLFIRRNWRDRLTWYEAQFAPGTQARGEASTSYSMHPYIVGVPERIRSVIPDVKLVYIVRDPIERLLSHYVEWRSLGFEKRPLNEALRDYESGSNPYVCTSMYASQIERYLEVFPRERLLVLDRQDLLERRASTLEKVFSHVGVDPSYSSDEFARELNPSGEKVRLTRLGRRLVRTRLVGPLPGPSFSPGLRRRALRRALTRRVEPPTLEPALRQKLLALFQEDRMRLRTHARRDFPGWSL